MTTKQTSQPDPDEPAAKPPPMPPVEEVPLSEIHPDPRNARRGNVAEIASSLREFGQHRAVVVQRSTGKIIAGNHVYHAARSMGWETIGVVFVDDDDEKALRRGIADNATGDLATWDTDILRELMEEVGTDIPGITDDRLEELAAIAADRRVLARWDWTRSSRCSPSSPASASSTPTLWWWPRTRSTWRG